MYTCSVWFVKGSVCRTPVWETMSLRGLPSRMHLEGGSCVMQAGNKLRRIFWWDYCREAEAMYECMGILATTAPAQLLPKTGSWCSRH